MAGITCFTASDVLRCSSFDDARERHRRVISTALAAPGAPPETAFRRHWDPGAEYHAGLRSCLEKAVATVAAEVAAEEARPASADDVLSCTTFDDAREKHPEIVSLALQAKGSPSEAVFRQQWAPDAKYHASLRGVIKAAVEEREKQPRVSAGPTPVPAATGPAADTWKVELTRHSMGMMWGFLVSKKMKVVGVDKGSPAEAAGLQKGVYVHEYNGVRCEVPKDAYGPPMCYDNTTVLTVSKDPPGAAPVGAPKEKKDDWICSGCGAHNFAIRAKCFGCGGSKGDYSQTGPPKNVEDDDWGVRTETEAFNKRKKGWDRHLEQENLTKAWDPEKPRAPPRIAERGDRVFRIDGKELVDYAWKLPAGEIAEVVCVWKGTDWRCGQLKLRGGPRNQESEWVSGEGWRCVEDGADIRLPPRQTGEKYLAMDRHSAILDQLMPSVPPAQRQGVAAERQGQLPGPGPQADLSMGGIAGAQHAAGGPLAVRARLQVGGRRSRSRSRSGEPLRLTDRRDRSRGRRRSRSRSRDRRR